MRTTLTTATLCALLLTAPRLASAEEGEDAEITRMAKEHYKLGLDAFKAGKYPEAIKELKKAYLLKRLSPLLINIAKTYEKIGDIDNEIYYYKKYLAEAPPEAKDRDQIKQTVDDLIAQKSGAKAPEEPPVAPEVRRKAQPEEPPVAPPPTSHKTKPQPEEPVATPPTSRKTKPEEPPATPPTTAPVAAPAPSEWTATPIDAAPPSKPVDVRVQTPVMKGVKVYLYYRGPGQADFTPVLMKRRGAEKIGRIPASEMGGKSIQYYVEAKDETGAVVKSSGSQADPNIIMIDPTAPPQFAAKEGSGEEEPETGEPQPKVKRRNNNIEDEDPFKKRKQTEEPSPITGPVDRKPGGPALSRNGVIIAGVAGGVALVSLALGVVGAVRAGQLAQAVHDDANNPASNGGLFLFNDPSAAPNDYDFQNQGKLWSLLSPIAFGLAGAAVIVGGILVLLDYNKMHPSAPKPVKKRHRRRRPVEDEPEATPRDDVPPSEQSSIRNFIAAPMVSPHTAGVGLGFSF